MKDKIFSKGNQRQFIIVYACLILMMTLSGCFPVHKGIEKLTHGMMSNVTTDCQVLSVEGTSGSNRYICRNSVHTYIYQNNAIYDYDTMEKLVKVEDLEFMTCNNDVLYYSVSNRGGQLFCYDFSEGTSVLITDEYRVVGMKAYGDDVFISQKINDGSGQENGSVLIQKEYELVYYHKRDEGISVKEWAQEHTGQSISDDYEIYEFEGYDIVADKSLGDDFPRFVFVENEEGFQYSCYGYNTYTKIDGEYIRLGIDVKCDYKGEETQLSEIINADSKEAGLSASQIGFHDDKVYMIVQYGKGTPGYQENPIKDFKSMDIFFEFLPETGKCNEVYRIKGGEQIAGFSYTKNCIYLLRNDGVYEYNLDTGDEKCAFENKGYTCLAFEYFEGKLFVFHDPYLSGDGLELVAVID